jgi:hypothetical protein
LRTEENLSSTENEGISLRSSLLHDLDTPNFEVFTTCANTWTHGFRRVSHPYNMPNATFLVLYQQNDGAIW